MQELSGEHAGAMRGAGNIEANRKERSLDNNEKNQGR